MDNKRTEFNIIYTGDEKIKGTPMYRIDDGLGRSGKEFVKQVTKIYNKKKDRYPWVKKPTSIRTAIAFAKLTGHKVFYKSPGSEYFEL